MPPEARDAFYQLVLYPVKACATVNEMYVAVGRNRLYAVQGRSAANDMAERARELFREDAALSREYNETLAGGKWKHMMDQTHIGYTYWNQPVRNAMPGVQEIQPSPHAEMGVAVEGSEASWPGGGGREPALPPLDVYAKQRRYVEVFNRGIEPFPFRIETSAPWLRVEPASGSVGRAQRVWVGADWSAGPEGASSASLVVTGPRDVKVTVKVPASNPASPRPEELRGFVESDGHVSIEAEHFTRAAAPAGRSWVRIPGHGRTLSGMTTLPVTAASMEPGPAGMWLEYRLQLFTAGTHAVDVYLAPTQKFQPGPGLRYAISFDDEPPQMINVHADTSLPAWEKSVADGVSVLRSKHALAVPGAHVLKLWAVDPGLVVQKIVLDTGGVRPSYLGPPESPRREVEPGAKR
jgi:hypothetical protein